LADANVNRIFARIFDIDEPVRRPEAQKRIAALAAALLPHGSARLFNQALMELGALVCAKKPLCAECPVSGFCEARRLGIVQERPIVEAKPDVTRIIVATGVLRHPERGAEIFIQKRRDDDLWPGLWEFPGGVVELEESPEQAVEREFVEETGITVRARSPIAVIRHSYTRYRVTLHGFWCEYVSGPLENPSLAEASAFQWVRDTRLAGFAFPSGHRKLADLLCPDLPLFK